MPNVRDAYRRERYANGQPLITFNKLNFMFQVLRFERKRFHLKGRQQTITEQRIDFDCFSQASSQKFGRRGENSKFFEQNFIYSEGERGAFSSLSERKEK
jgi:hypothetical protein